MSKSINIDITAATQGDSGMIQSKVTWRDFVQLTKPGIIRSNLLGAFAGFWLASKWQIDWWLMLYALLGVGLVMASACVMNNYLDREMDTKMERTQHRVLPAGKVKPSIVLWYGITLGIAGSIILLSINTLSFVLGLVGMFFYVIVYTLWLKRTSTWSTSVGGVSGAMPPVIGYCAVQPELDMGAVLLFALLFLWQPPHFWALGIRRKEEYRAAGFPLLPVVKGVLRTKIQMIPYVVLLLPVPVLFYMYGYTGLIFLIVSLGLTIVWLMMCLAGFKTQDDNKWARKTFLFSIYYLMLVFLVMILNTTSV